MQARLGDDPHAQKSPNELQNLFEDGLNDDIKSKLWAVDFATRQRWTGANFDEFINMCVIIETQNKGKRLRHGHSTDKPLIPRLLRKERGRV